MYCSCRTSCGIHISPKHLILVDVITTNILKSRIATCLEGNSQTQLKCYWLMPGLVYSAGCSVVPINLSLLAIIQIFSPLHGIIGVLNYTVYRNFWEGVHCPLLESGVSQPMHGFISVALV
jgi:hypothetical protein